MDRAYAAPARHPVIHAAVLAWVWVIVVFAPMGATLHALTHLRPLLSVSAGAPGMEGQEHIGAADGDDRAPHGAPAHCHGCDAWQFFDHVLPLASAGAPPSHDAGPPHTTAGATRASIETPWILPRAPPSHA
ncbi:hypothetical protein [Bordetella flabilis]|uniref:hypothetical protein n=1 Tax=Bordetella flabilis TaxID=463014 RepID=UPI0018DE12CA